MALDDSPFVPGSTPTGYQRTQGGGVNWQPPTAEHLGKLLPQYEVDALIGRGGMGAVYRGTQKSLNRAVAIKILPPEFDDEAAGYVQRFRNEAQIMARFTHPAIVAVHDFGETSEGQLYFIMEFVEGGDVQKMINDQGTLPPAHALAITAHVCDALSCAHSHGIVHRDIKPANVILNLQGEVKVADFGLAKASEGGQAPGLTMSGMSMGTPDYVAPETLTRGMVADHRADLYAVGVMLYHMLTGEVPRGKFKMPSHKVGSDARFDAIIDRAMENDPAERYQSAAEIRRDLDVIITTPLMQAGGQSSAAIPKQALAAKESVGMRKPWLIPAAFAGVAALCTGGWLALKPGPQVEAKAVQSLRPAQAARDKAPPAKSVVFTHLALPEESASRAKAHDYIAPAKPVVAVQEPPPPTPPSPPKAVSPMPGGPGISATALQDAAAPKQQPVQVATAPPAALAARAPSGDGSKPPAALPAELSALDAQFQQLQTERVTAPFETDVLKLNASYLSGLDREMAKEQAAGHLDAILALETEKKLITDKQPMPDAEVDKTTATLKDLRGIYRTAYAKIDATRAANLKALTDPLDARLAGLETDFTKRDRLPDAKVVREYREALISAVAGVFDPGGAKQASGGKTSPSSPRSQTPATASTIPDGLKPVNPAAVLAVKDGFTNTLGMKFVPVKGTAVLFCIHETRHQDYAVYANEVPGVDTGWKKQSKDGIPAGDKNNHPVVGVSYNDAVAFCAWLSKKEGKPYRLPTDREWSYAAGIGREEKWTKGTTPERLSGKVLNEFPWGSKWPPPQEAGNYADTAWNEKFPTYLFIEGYSDGFATTAPVMSFKPNKLGIYDLGGNACEWVEDWWNAAKVDRVLRGGSWGNIERFRLLSSARDHNPPGDRHVDRGFRCVVVVSGG